MTDRKQREAAKEFAGSWKGKGYEKGQSQAFWMNLLRNVYGVERPEEFITFEDQVHLDRTSFIDGHIAATHVLIEQKGLGKDLKKPIKQSDGSLLTPFQQAKRYAAELPYSQRPRWIVTCNFGCFHVYDMEKPTGEPAEILLENLPDEYYRLKFLVDTGDSNIKKEMEISIQAGELVGRLYDAILKRYKDPSGERTLKSLNMLCVRLVFCLYAEDAGIFGRHNMFHDYLRERGEKSARHALIDLFNVLDTAIEDRDPYLDDDLAAFPYVNGDLFLDKDIEIPQFDHEIFALLLSNASEDFNWSAISPTIFGAVFESTLNPETRRSGGMHYTSIDNIHKVIDPLFLNELRKEFEEIQGIAQDRTRNVRLKEFQAKLAGLVFLDPACGSGNFLTETYVSLRRLENETIRRMIAGQKGAAEGQIVIGGEGEFSPIQVSIGQLYGIEINDFAVSVAKTALWIAESQMMKQTEDVVHMNLDFLPLKSYANIVEKNALRVDWETVVPRAKLNYIMGNPPFVGASKMNDVQKQEAVAVFGKVNRANSIDYVGAWYHKAASFMQGTSINVAFVSTNSITQGEQVAALWGKLLEQYHVQIIFAYRTFKWNSEATEKAAVHCVIIGFCVSSFLGKKWLYVNETTVKEVKEINPYLIEAPSILVVSRSQPLCEVPKMTAGNKPSDGGNLILSQQEQKELVTSDPSIEPFIRRYIGSQDFINRDQVRYCLWLKDIPANKYRNNKEIMRRLQAVHEMRLNSNATPTRQLADMPYRFFSTPQKEGVCLCIPEVSSEQRRYIPMGFLEDGAIASNKLLIIPDAEIYHLGVLISNVHMSWTRTVSGRLEMRYQYSGAVVYNTFPWPNPTEEQKARIEKTAQSILDARALYPDCSLADLYDELTMPPEIRKAHQQNDRAVMIAYGMPVKETTESSCVSELMKRYQEMTSGRKNPNN